MFGRLRGCGLVGGCHWGQAMRSQTHLISSLFPLLPARSSRCELSAALVASELLTLWNCKPQAAWVMAFYHVNRTGTNAVVGTMYLSTGSFSFLVGRGLTRSVGCLESRHPSPDIMCSALFPSTQISVLAIKGLLWSLCLNLHFCVTYF